MAMPSDNDAEVNVCVALYFVTYFHINNNSCRQYLSKQNPNDPMVTSFLKVWIDSNKLK